MLQEVSVSTEVLKKNLGGINIDGAAVNLGKTWSMSTWVNICTVMSRCVVHCIARTLKVVVCDSKKDIGYLNDFEVVLEGIFQLYLQKRTL